jgi:hypothetical protein
LFLDCENRALGAPGKESAVAEIYGRPENAYRMTTLSSTSCLSFSSEPVSSKEFVSTAFPFSTLVMT